MKSCLILASVASHIGHFHIPSIEILQSMGFHVDVACNFVGGNPVSDQAMEELKKRFKEMNVQYYQIDFSRKLSRITQNIKAIRQVINLAKEKKYAFIHCHTPFGGVAGRVAGKFTGTKVIYTAHGFHFFEDAPLINWMLYYPVEKFLSRWTDLLITINKEDYQRAKDHFHMKKLEYIPGVGIDLKKFRVAKDVAIDKRAELNIPPTTKILFSVGELSVRKNHAVVIEALAKLKTQGKLENVLYIVCGQGDLKSALEQQIERAGLQNNVRLLGYRNDIGEICNIADVFVFPSLQEGLPVALMEAMACGLPCVVSDIRGNTDLIEDGVGGYLCNPTDADAFAREIYELLADEKKRAAMGEKNIKQIQSFTLQNVKDNMKQVYYDISL